MKVEAILFASSVYEGYSWKSIGIVDSIFDISKLKAEKKINQQSVWWKSVFQNDTCGLLSINWFINQNWNYTINKMTERVKDEKQATSDRKADDVSCF